MQTAASAQAGLAIQDPGGKNHGKMGGILAGVILLKSPPGEWQNIDAVAKMLIPENYSGEYVRQLARLPKPQYISAIFTSPLARWLPQNHRNLTQVGGANQTCVPSARLIRSAASVQAAPESR
jgi:hypothetical protein